MAYNGTERPFKIILCGKKGVGKTTLLRLLSDSTGCIDNPMRLQSNTDQPSKVTMKINCNGKVLKAEVWDTGSLEAHGGSQTLTKSYYRGAHAALLIYVMGNAESKTGLIEWADTVQHHSPDCVLSLWCNNRSHEFGSSLKTRNIIDALAQKYDIDQNRCVTYTEGDVYGIHTQLQTLITELDSETFTSPITDSIMLNNEATEAHFHIPCLSCMKSN